jgi:hypothetical protein
MVPCAVRRIPKPVRANHASRPGCGGRRIAVLTRRTQVEDVPERAGRAQRSHSVRFRFRMPYAIAIATPPKTPTTLTRSKGKVSRIWMGTTITGVPSIVVTGIWTIYVVTPKVVRLRRRKWCRQTVRKGARVLRHAHRSRCM